MAPLLKYKSFNGKSMHKYPLAICKNYALKFVPHTNGKNTPKQGQKKSDNATFIVLKIE